MAQQHVVCTDGYLLVVYGVGENKKAGWKR